MDGKSILPKVGSGLSIPLGALLVILFFAPWLNLTCAGKAIGEASGWELMKGDMSLTKEFEEQGGTKNEDSDEGPDARAWAIGGLIVPILAILVGVAGLLSKVQPKVVGAALVVLAVVGLIVVILAMNVDYADEMAKDKQQDEGGSTMGPPPEQIKEMLATKATPWLYISLLLYVLTAGCGVLCLIPTKASQDAGVAAPPPAAV